jgi:hypothetical protein
VREIKDVSIKGLEEAKTESKTRPFPSDGRSPAQNGTLED